MKPDEAPLMSLEVAQRLFVPMTTGGGLMKPDEASRVHCTCICAGRPCICAGIDQYMAENDVDTNDSFNTSSPQYDEVIEDVWQAQMNDLDLTIEDTWCILQCSSLAKQTVEEDLVSDVMRFRRDAIPLPIKGEENWEEILLAQSRIMDYGHLFGVRKALFSNHHRHIHEFEAASVIFDAVYLEMQMSELRELDDIKTRELDDIETRKLDDINPTSGVFSIRGFSASSSNAESLCVSCEATQRSFCKEVQQYLQRHEKGLLGLSSNLQYDSEVPPKLLLGASTLELSRFTLQHDFGRRSASEVPPELLLGASVSQHQPPKHLQRDEEFLERLCHRMAVMATSSTVSIQNIRRSRRVAAAAAAESAVGIKTGLPPCFLSIVRARLEKLSIQEAAEKELDFDFSLFGNFSNWNIGISQFLEFISKISVLLILITFSDFGKDFSCEYIFVVEHSKITVNNGI